MKPILEVALTSFCRGDCFCCPYGATRNGEMMDSNVLLDSLETLSSDIVSEVIFAGGEALFHPRIKECTDLLRARGIPFQVYTPYWPKEIEVDDLKQILKGGRALLPVWATDQRIHSFVAGWDYQETVEAFSLFTLVGIPTVCYITVTGLTIHLLQQTVETVTGWGASHVAIERALAGRGARASWPFLMPLVPQSISYLDANTKVERHKSLLGQSCRLAPAGFYLGMSGDISPCIYLQQVTLGNVAQVPLSTIITQRMSWKLKESPSECQGCGFFLAPCLGGCQAASVIYSEGLERRRPDPLCQKYGQETIAMIARNLWWEEEHERTDDAASEAAGAGPGNLGSVPRAGGPSDPEGERGEETSDREDRGDGQGHQELQGREDVPVSDSTRSGD